jgi:hypothetical protein
MEAAAGAFFVLLTVVMVFMTIGVIVSGVGLLAIVTLSLAAAFGKMAFDLLTT